MMRIRVALLSTAALLAVASGARAQSVNYGQLEQFFGEPVTTSATGSPQKAADAPANLEIISQDDIRRSGATSIPDILRYVSGVDVREYSRGQQDVSVRGYAQSMSPRLLVLVNGRQVYSDDFGYTSWDTIPVQLEEIRQIEVARGPNSALFGFNAVGGVINIITFDPLNDKVQAATASAGTDGYASGSAVGTVHVGQTFGLRLSAGGSRDDAGSSEGQAAAGSDHYGIEPWKRSAAADARWQVTPDVLATLDGTWSQSEHETMLVNESYLGDSVYRNNSVKIGLAADTGLGLMSLNAYRNEQRDSFLSAAEDLHDDDISYVVQVSDLFKIGADHTFRIGGEYRNNALTSNLLSGTTGYEVYAASAMWNWQITPSVALTNSLRLDHLTLNRDDPVISTSPYSLSQYQNASLTEPSYNSGLVYKASDDDTIRLLASRGVQAPSLVDFGMQFPIKSGDYTVGALAGNPDTNAAIVTNYEVDYDRALPALNSTLRTSAYWQNTRDVIAPGFEVSPTYLRLTPIPWVVEETQNEGSSRAVGGEIGIRGKSDGWRWNLSYSLSKIHDQLRYAYSAQTPYAVDFADGTPTSIVIGGLGYSVDKWEIDLNARWQSHFTDFSTDNAGKVQPKVINGYLTDDLRVGYLLTPALQLAMTVQQMTQQTIVESTGEPVERRAVFSISLKY